MGGVNGVPLSVLLSFSKKDLEVEGREGRRKEWTEGW